MSLFSNLSSDTRLEIVSNQKRLVLERMYIYLIRMGINPELFDKDSYTPQDEGDLNEGEIYSQNELISSIDEYNLLSAIEQHLESATPNS